LMLLVLFREHIQQHQDLFNSNRLTFSEALAKLYQRLNPQIDMGQRTPQTIGEELLDYLNFHFQIVAVIQQFFANGLRRALPHINLRIK
ncbi:hypothetical protein ACUOFC_59585, partial [Escherichia sp. TWPC-MK]